MIEQNLSQAKNIHCHTMGSCGSLVCFLRFGSIENRGSDFLGYCPALRSLHLSNFDQCCPAIFFTTTPYMFHSAGYRHGDGGQHPHVFIQFFSVLFSNNWNLNNSDNIKQIKQFSFQDISRYFNFLFPKLQPLLPAVRTSTFFRCAPTNSWQRSPAKAPRTSKCQWSVATLGWPSCRSSLRSTFTEQGKTGMCWYVLLVFF